MCQVAVFWNDTQRNISFVQKEIKKKMLTLILESFYLAVSTLTQINICNTVKQCSVIKGTL
jgi:hypothetical protein